MRVAIVTDGGVLYDEIASAVESTGIKDKISIVRTYSGRFSDDEIARWCEDNKKPCTPIENVELHGKSVCFKRNDKIVAMSDVLIVITNEGGKTIMHPLEEFRKKRKRIYRFYPKGRK